MKKVVIAGSVSLQDKINYYRNYFKLNHYYVLDYPRPIKEQEFLKSYPDIHQDFFKNIMSCDILFIMNEDKNGVEGYLGYETFAELNFGVMLKLICHKDIKIYLLKMPSSSVGCYREICLWLELGWIKIFDKNV